MSLRNWTDLIPPCAMLNLAREHRAMRAKAGMQSSAYTHAPVRRPHVNKWVTSYSATAPAKHYSPLMHEAGHMVPVKVAIN